MLYLAWLRGHDPWRLYNMLDEDYRPLWNPEREAMRPKTPTRLKAFLYACAAVAGAER